MSNSLCCPPGSSVKARTLEWVATSFSRGSFWSRDQNHFSCLAGGMFITEPAGKPSIYLLCCAVLCLVAQSCLTLWDPMDCSPPSPSVHEILQATILEWVAISSSRGSSQPRDQVCIFCIDRILYHCITWEAQGGILLNYKKESAICSNMVEPRDYHTKSKRNIICHLYVASKKKI